MYLNRESNYEKHPRTRIHGFKEEVFSGYEDIIEELKKRCAKRPFVLTVDCYPGVDDGELLGALKALGADRVILTEELFKGEQTIRQQLKYQLTDDRVFGKLYAGEIRDFMDEEKLEKAAAEVKDASGLTLIYGDVYKGQVPSCSSSATG